MSADDVRGHTGIHVLKGAVFHVLGEGAKWSASAGSQGTHGHLAVQFERKPTNEEISLIEEKANAEIRENAPIETLELTRAEAERRWGDYIYDLFPIPSEITTLKVFNLPGWNVNTCGKQHTARTGEIGSIKIAKWRYRGTKRLLEISFDVE